MIEHGTLEANIIRHCQNRCTACSHASPWAKPYAMPPEVLKADLEAMAKVMRVKQFYLLGGEPLLHPQLMECIDIANDSPIAEQTCILTNGILLSKMPEEFWQKIDVLRVSAYPNLDRTELSYAEEKQKRYGFFFGIDNISTFWKQFAVKPCATHFQDCPWKGACWTIHDGHFYLCPNAAFWPEQFMGLPQHIDGLPIHGATEQQFMDYIERKEPFVTCRICHPFKEQMPWQQSKTFADWIKESTL